MSEFVAVYSKEAKKSGNVDSTSNTYIESAEIAPLGIRSDAFPVFDSLEPLSSPQLQNDFTSSTIVLHSLLVRLDFFQELVPVRDRVPSPPPTRHSCTMRSLTSQLQLP